jgi:hypothetical protein
LWPKASFTALKPSRSSISAAWSRRAPVSVVAKARGGLEEAFAVEQARERIVVGPKVELARRAARLRVRVPQLRGHEQRLVLQPAAGAERAVAAQRGVNERAQVHHHHQRQRVV